MALFAAKSPGRRAQLFLPSFARVAGAALLIIVTSALVKIPSSGVSDVPELMGKQADALRAADRRKVVQKNNTPTSSTLVVDDMVFYAPKSPPATPDNTRTSFVGLNQTTPGLYEVQTKKEKNEIPTKEKKPGASFQAIIPRREETNPQPRVPSGEPPFPGSD